MSDYVEHPREELRLVESHDTLREVVDSLARAEGPVAVDAERAHGHRYWPKAYLLQLRREGAGTWLLDPLPFEHGERADLSPVSDATRDATWIIHAASQDLPCLREVGMYPRRLFDTELAGRLLGEPGVSLGALLESKLGIRLRKAHSADNWATRPLPEAWLRYAALDVDYLLELHSALSAELEARERLDWAEQEFAHVLRSFAQEPDPRADPWRRLSGITDLRHPRQLAVARALWEERDTLARERDRPPGRILADAAIVATAAQVTPDGPVPRHVTAPPSRGSAARGATRFRANWARALDAVAQLPASQYPPRRLPGSGIPHPRNWERTQPEAAALWQGLRPAVDALAEELGIHASLLAPSALLQQVVYTNPDLREPEEFDRALEQAGARPWQRDLLAPLVGRAHG